VWNRSLYPESQNRIFYWSGPSGAARHAARLPPSAACLFKASAQGEHRSSVKQEVGGQHGVEFRCISGTFPVISSGPTIFQRQLENLTGYWLLCKPPSSVQNWIYELGDQICRPLKIFCSSHRYTVSASFFNQNHEQVLPPTHNTLR
jgi:hypothetical protein